MKSSEECFRNVSLNSDGEMMAGTLIPDAVSSLDTSRAREPSRLRRGAGRALGWAWRIFVGTVLCYSGPILSWFTSILVVGWLQRWVRNGVLFRWWKESKARDLIPFEELGDTYKDGTPVLLPNWFLSERAWTLRSLWLNFSLGVKTLLCIYLTLGLGCLVMFFSWEIGWNLSFNKSYEEAAIGLATGVVGSLLFVAGFLYLPMARTHAAVIGDLRGFFDARLVWQLIRARPGSYTGLILLIGLVSLPLEAMRLAVIGLGNADHLRHATDAQVLEVLSRHLVSMAFMLFLALIVTQGFAARVYRRALHTGLSEGWLEPADLGPRLYLILSQLELIPERKEARRGILRVLRWTWRWYSRRFLFAVMLLLAVGFIVKIYIGYFTVAQPFAGFMNHPLLQFPCVDYVPGHLLD